MLKRTLLIVLVALLALAPTAVFAQSTPEAFCDQLEEADCQILQQSQEAMMEVSSALSNSEMEINLTNVQGLPVKEIAVTLNLQQNSFMDADYMKEMQEMLISAADTMKDDPEGFLQDYLGMVSGIYSKMNLDLAVDLTINDELADFASSQVGIEVPTQISTDFRLVDGFAYINLDDIASALPDMGIPEGWYGIDLATLMEKQMDQAMAAMEEGGNNEMAAMMQGQMAGIQMGLAMSGMGGEQNQELQDALGEIVELTRLDDTEVSGTEVAQFESFVDFAALLTNQTIIDMILEQAKASGAAAELGDMDPDQIAGMLQLAAPMLTQGLEMTSVKSVGLEDGYVYGSEVNMNWDMTSVMTLAQMGLGGGGKPPKRPKADERPTFMMHILSESSDFNEAPEIEAPADAQVIPLEALEQ